MTPTSTPEGIGIQPWLPNLGTPIYSRPKGVEGGEIDELAGLRELAEQRGKGRGGDKPPKPEKEKDRSKSPVRGSGAKEKKKKKKERTAEKEYEELLAKKEEVEELERGQKSARALFSNTCLDPNVPRRKRLMKKARRVSKKKDKKRKRSESTDSGSSSSSSSEAEKGSEEDGPLFDETRRVRRLSERCPEHLLSSRGELHSVSP